MTQGSGADYVVVGAGTAGCALAARLSEDASVSVTLIELGGPDSNPAIYDRDMRSMFGLWNPSGAENWGYRTVPQPGLGGRVIDIARGRVLGGSSAVNAMLHVRGNRRDFDGWARLGNRGWAYHDVLPYFRRAETYHGEPSAGRGDSGPVSVIDGRVESLASRAFIAAAAELGLGEPYHDFNGPAQEGGAGLYQSTRTPDGVRVSAASAYLRPARSRPNLRVLTGTRVTSIVLERGRATGVRCRTGGGEGFVAAGREVVLCCGAFESPKLLLLSGLGPAADLAALGIAVRGDLPGVGRNLQDHMLLGVGYESTVPLEPPELLAESGLFTWTRDAPAERSPDLQYFFGPVQFLAPQYMTGGPGFTFAPVLAQPRSRGTVTLASTDPAELARVDPRYLSDDADVAVFERAIRLARELVATNPFSSFRGRELAPGPQVTGGAELRAYVRAVAGTVWHPAGTCRMGADPEAVVDDRLRVRGVEGLRVADASVMPNVVCGNPNAAVTMIAERAADLIRSDRAPAGAKPAFTPVGEEGR